MGAPRQPDDAWSFVRGGDDDEPLLPAAAEEDAVHVVEDLSPPSDPSRSDLGVVVEPDAPIAPDDAGPPEGGWFGDEEPDPFLATVAGDDEADHEPDLEEILESQHYAFDQDGEGADGLEDASGEGAGLRSR